MLNNKRYSQKTIPKLGTEWDDKNQGELKKLAQDYYNDNFLGKSTTNQHKNIVVLFAKSGIRHVLNFGAREYIKFKAIKLLPQLIEYAEFKNFKKADDDDEKSILGYMNFEVKANIEGLIYKLRLVIRITNNGKFYYHHAKKMQ